MHCRRLRNLRKDTIKDFLDNEVKVGDYFAYPLVIGRSANMAIFQLTAILDDGRVKARPVTRAYGERKEWKYKTFDYDNKTGLGAFREMNEKERAKVDGKRSTLQMFSKRAVHLPAFTE